MIYPPNIEQKLGFDQIREILKNECLGSLGQRFVEKIQFSSDHKTVEKFISQTADFKSLLEQEALFPASNYIDVTPSLKHATIEGSFLSPEAFYEIKLSLRTIFRCLDFFDENEGFSFLKELTVGIVPERKILKKLDNIFDDKGNIMDHASAELKEIRMSLLSEQVRVRRELDKILRSLKKDGYTEEDVSITIRNGRMVVPIAAEYKRKIKGFVHDESATGQTVFLEPAQVLEINNEIRDLEYREKREIIKILTELTDFLRPHIPDLRKAYTFLGIIDFIRAKAKVAIQLGATLPKLENKCIVDWIDARHPLLYYNLKKIGKEVVPLNINLQQEKRILVISGPNAGGKSVCLKTVGLNQYMLQCGLLIPMSEASTAGIFQNIFIDIGDEQSIEDDLSTYSSHLKNMKHFLNFSDRRSLILIDEFGTGTEPQFGAAIAETVLENLNSLEVFAVITTHYSNLKQYAESTKSVVNGAMRFDMDKLEPLYELEIGQPGSSFALEIARKIGLSNEIIERSKQKLGKDQVQMDQLLRELEMERTTFKAKNDSARNKEISLDKLISEYADLKNFLDTHKKRLLNEAKLEAKALVADANQKIENTIREIREKKADKETTKVVREILQEFNDTLKIEKIQEPTVDLSVETIGGEIGPGDFVRIRDNGALGEVVSVKDKDVELMIGSLKSNIKLKRLDRISRKEYKKHTGEEFLSPLGINMNEKMSNFSPNIDIRGKRAEEALQIVDELLDNALIFSTNELRIVHGKGDGILRTMIRNHLKSYKQVIGMADDHADRGGAGVTVVTLR